MYSYDLLENAAGLGMHSADRILPEHQRLDVGDVIPLGPDVGIPVRRMETGSVLGLGGTMDPRTGKIISSGVHPQVRGWSSAGRLCCNPSTSAPRGCCPGRAMTIRPCPWD